MVTSIYIPLFTTLAAVKMKSGIKRHWRQGSRGQVAHQGVKL